MRAGNAKESHSLPFVEEIGQARQIVIAWTNLRTRG
jgi:hypothetical protein